MILQNDYIVLYANPYSDYDECCGNKIFSLKSCQRGCIYNISKDNQDPEYWTLVPIKRYKDKFLEKSVKIHDLEFHIINYKLFSFPDEIFKAEGFRVYIDKMMLILEKVKNNPNKYYLKYGNYIIRYDNNSINGSSWRCRYRGTKVEELITYDYLLNIIFKYSWEYDYPFKLKKSSILKRLILKKLFK